MWEYFFKKPYYPRNPCIMYFVKASLRNATFFALIFPCLLLGSIQNHETVATKFPGMSFLLFLNDVFRRITIPLFIENPMLIINVSTMYTSHAACKQFISISPTSLSSLDGISIHIL